MDLTGRNRRPHDGRLSSERNSPSLSRARIFVHLLEGTGAPRLEVVRSRDSEKRGFCNHAFRRFSADAGLQEDNLRQLLRFWLWRELVSEFTCAPQSLLLPRSWPLQLDSHHPPRRDRIVALTQARRNSRPLFGHRFRRIPLSDRLLSGLGRPLVLRQPLLRLPHRSFRSRPSSLHRLFRARLERTSHLARRSSRDNPADPLEFWTHLPMGHAPDSRSRPDFLAPGGVQSSSGSAGPDRRNSEALRYPQRSIDA